MAVLKRKNLKMGKSEQGKSKKGQRTNLKNDNSEKERAILKRKRKDTSEKDDRFENTHIWKETSEQGQI